MLSEVPVGISTPVRLVKLAPQFEQWLSWSELGATW